MIQSPPPVLPLAADSSAQINRTEQASFFAEPIAETLPVMEEAASPKHATCKLAGHSKSRGISPSNNAAGLKASPTSARLRIKATGGGKRESWTVATTTKPATKGSRQACFRVRVSDVGFRVCLVYYDDQGNRREPYLCYLSAKEWRQAKRGSLANFAQIVIDKLADRAAKEGADGGKLSELSWRVKAFL